VAIALKNLQVSFLRSCSSIDGLPADGIPEVAVLGRSNVGKSSLLNTLTGQAGLAHVSKTPGRTRLLNFFSVMIRKPGQRADSRPALYLVDFPGYGYAKVSRDTFKAFADMAEPYLLHRKPLRLSLLLVDPMIPPQAMDQDLHALLTRRGQPVCVVATKWDRLSQTERARAKKVLKETYRVDPLPFSSKTGEGRDALWTRLLQAVENDGAGAPAATSQ
jgi:GTP-binding protein